MVVELIRGVEYIIKVDVLAAYDRIYKAPFKAIYIGIDLWARPEFCTVEINGVHSGHDLFSIDKENIIEI